MEEQHLDDMHMQKRLKGQMAISQASESKTHATLTARMKCLPALLLSDKAKTSLHKKTCKSELTAQKEEKKIATDGLAKVKKNGNKKLRITVRTMTIRS